MPACLPYAAHSSVLRSILGVSLWCVLGIGAREARASADRPLERPSIRANLVLTQKDLPPLHLKSHIVQALIQGRVASVSVESVYRNDQARDLEATFVFPLPEGAAVERFTLWMDGQPVEAKIAEKERARTIYQSIVNRNKDPGLLEQIGENLFQYRIFPVRANADQKVRLEYSQILAADAKDGTLRFEYPLYTPTPRDATSQAARDFVLSVKIEAEGPIATLESPTHTLSRRIDAKDPRLASASIEESFAALDKDFELRIGLKEKTPALSALAYRAGAANGAQAEDGFVMVFLNPQLPQGEELPGKDVVLVMDTSGSMKGEKIEQARAALYECLKRLQPNDRFAIVGFSDAVSTFSPNWSAAGENYFASARAFIRDLEAAGGTNIGAAVEGALAYPAQAGRLRQILFATDGCPTVGETNPELLVKQAVAGGSAATRFFTFGIGFDVNAVLLDKISGRTGGARAYVTEKERIDRKLAGLCERIATPVLTDVRVEFSGDLGVEQLYPPRLSDLYLGQQTVLTARYKRSGAGQLIVKGKRGGREVALETSINLPARTPEAAAFLPKQWALRKTGYLLDQIRLNGESAELKDEVVRLGTRYRIVTPYTSYLALEKADEARFGDELGWKKDSRNTRLGTADTPPTDPPASSSAIVVPPDILARADRGDHFETINRDRPDTQSAFGNPDARIFHSLRGSDRDAGGGGMGGAALDDLIGLGGSNSPGSGGGWGGGDGTGTGVDKGSARGSISSRGAGGRRLMVLRHGGSKATESGVDAGLQWLAKNQEADGRWDAKKYSLGTPNDLAETSWALLAFLGAGHSEKVGRYKDKVKLAIGWLASKQREDGLIYASMDAPRADFLDDGHLLAGLALAEAAGMGRVPETIQSAQKALDYSVQTQASDQGLARSTWLLAPASGAGPGASAAWYVMQLKSAKVAGLKVGPKAFQGAIQFLDSLERKDGQGLGHRYANRPAEQEASFRATAAGCLCRQFLGWKRDDLQGGIEWVVREAGLPAWDGKGAQVDLPFWYFGTLCAFQQGGEIWKNWNAAQKQALCLNQRKGGTEDGSWDPAGSAQGTLGRVGQTALAGLCLETYYRYLPLYSDGAGPGASSGSSAPAPSSAPVLQAPKAESGREAVEYSEYLRALQEGRLPGE